MNYSKIFVTAAFAVALTASGQVTLTPPTHSVEKPASGRTLSVAERPAGNLSVQSMPLPGHSPFYESTDMMPPIEIDLGSLTPEKGVKKSKTHSLAASDNDPLQFNYLALYDTSWTDGYNFGLFQYDTSTKSTTQLAAGDRFYGADFAIKAGDVLYTSVPLSNGYTYRFETDANTYEQLNYKYVSAKVQALSAAYDRTADKIYGCFLAEDKTYFYYAEYDREAMKPKDPIANYGSLGISAMAFNRRGELYGITNNGIFCKIDKATGELTGLLNFNVSFSYNISGCFHPKYNLFYFNAFLSGSQSYIYQVNVDDLTAANVGAVPNSAEMQGMWLVADPFDDEMPAEPTDFSVVYDAPSLVGTVNFTLPATFISGDIPADDETMEYEVYYNGTLKLSGTGHYGEQLSLPVEAVTRGQYTVDLKVRNALGYGPALSTELYIGYDDITNVKDFKFVIDEPKFNLSWSAPSPVHGGYYNPDDISYDIVRYPANETVVTGYKGTSLSLDILDDWADGEYKFGITVNYYDPDTEATAKKPEVMSNTRLLGAYKVPFNYDFSQPDEAAQLFTVIDSNNDGIRWVFPGGSAAIQYNDMVPMNDWLITMPVEFEAGKTYSIYATLDCDNDNYPEKAELWIGNASTVAGMTQQLVGTTVISDKTILTGNFLPSADGMYYIGVHGVSDADTYVLRCYAIGAEAVGTADAPGAATNMTATACFDTDDFTAWVEFDAPTVTAGGDKLETIDYIEIIRNGDVATTFTDVTPGQHFKYLDTCPESRVQEYTVKAYNEHGVGFVATASVFVGFGQPLSIKEIFATYEDDDNTTRQWWDPVTHDIYGRRINRTMWYQPMAIFPNTAQCTAGNGIYTSPGFTFSNINTKYHQLNSSYDPDVNEQFFIRYYCSNFYYEGLGLWQGPTHGGATIPFSDFVPVGKPYSLPYKESFDNCELHGLFVHSQCGTHGAWSLSDVCDDTPSASCYDGDGGMVIFTPKYFYDRATLLSGKINLREAVVPTLTFYYYAVNGSRDKVTIDIDYKGTVTNVASIELGSTGVDGWTKATVKLDKFAGKVVRYYLGAECISAHSLVLVDDIEIFDCTDNSLAITSFAAPSSARVDREMSVNATVTNTGHDTMAAYTATLYVNEVPYTTVEGASLASGESEELTFGYTPSVTEDEGLSFRLAINVEGDDNLADNESETLSVRVVTPNYPTVTDLEAVSDGRTVTLSWNQPTGTGDTAETIADDVETYTPFSIGLPNSELGEEDYMGRWTVIDRDGNETYQLMGVDFTNNRSEGSPKAWMVFNGDKSGIADKYPKYADDYRSLSGKQSFLCIAAAPGTNGNPESKGNDDWLISPLLSGNEQTITFYARAISDAYGAETYEVLYSLEGTDPDDFIKAGEESVTRSWTHNEYALPTGAKYFAIRCTSYDVWGLMIDDITYEAGADADLELLGYNVYRNRTPLLSTHQAETEFVEDGVTDGQHVYHVSAVYNLGESALSNGALVTISASGIDAATVGGITVSVAGNVITVSGAEGESITLCAIDGKVIENAVGTDVNRFTVASGIYIVNVGSVTVKVIAQ